MRILVLLATLFLPAAAQQTATDRLVAQTRAALDKDDLTAAADLAARLDDTVANRYASWLIRDANERVDETLRWLPADTESFWVDQMPFVTAAGPPDMVRGQASRNYATDRLRALDGGEVWKLLQGKMIRIVAAGARGLKSASGQVPAVASQRDIVYFYFLAEPLDLAPFPVPDLRMSGKPVWDAVGAREDEHWYSLARPDLLILANRKDSLAAVLRRVAGESGVRAMPASLPEWRLVDRNAGFWGLRHAGLIDLRLMRHGGTASGVALSYDGGSQKLDIRCLTAVSAETAAKDPLLEYQFHDDQPEPGVLRMTADIAERGDFPFHYGMMLLGMGLYR